MSDEGGSQKSEKSTSARGAPSTASATPTTEGKVLKRQNSLLSSPKATRDRSMSLGVAEIPLHKSGSQKKTKGDLELDEVAPELLALEDMSLREHYKVSEALFEVREGSIERNKGGPALAFPSLLSFTSFPSHFTSSPHSLQRLPPLLPFLPMTFTELEANQACFALVSLSQPQCDLQHPSFGHCNALFRSDTPNLGPTSSAMSSECAAREVAVQADFENFGSNDSAHEELLRPSPRLLRLATKVYL